MAKLVRILAASVSGGMALGFGMRVLSEAAQKRQTGPAADGEKALGLRVGAMEERLLQLESGPERTKADRLMAAAIEERIDAAEAKLQRACDSIREDAEQRLRDAVQDEAFLKEAVAKVERVVSAKVQDRIELIEASVASQSAELRELREYSLSSERNIQRLLAGIDRLISSQDAATAGTGAGRAEPHPAPGRRSSLFT